MRVLITGGAGFVGSSLALTLKRELADVQVCALDNLRRRGSELALSRLHAADVEFVHGDVRSADDLVNVGAFDLLIECSAEPSVHAGFSGSPAYVIDTNLGGTVRCLEAARAHRADVIFLSTSRVYPIDWLRALPYEPRGERFDLAEGSSGQGWSFDGITTDFPMSGHRSMYGATKLAAELVVEEYRAMYGLRTVINRCGVIAGPWQMAKADQGFVVLWAARHLFGGALNYIGFGGEGLQVRDILHVADLCDLILIQIRHLSDYSGKVFNVGGGRERSVSLAELTRLCRDRVRDAVTPGRVVETQAADVPYFVTDNALVTAATGWRPLRGTGMLLDDIFGWLTQHRVSLEPIIGESLARASGPVRALSRS
jgi:CDP-paratose 2-epimerase